MFSSLILKIDLKIFVFRKKIKKIVEKKTTKKFRSQIFDRKCSWFFRLFSIKIFRSIFFRPKCLVEKMFAIDNFLWFQKHNTPNIWKFSGMLMFWATDFVAPPLQQRELQPTISCGFRNIIHQTYGKFQVTPPKDVAFIISHMDPTFGLRRPLF